MADSATIVAASLDSSQLEQSINKLVATVASKTKEMADNFTKEVGRMEQAVKNLGNIKIDSGGTADGGSSRRTSKQKEEEEQVKATTQAYKEQRITLDQQATAMQKAIRPKSAEDSYYTVIKNMRENVALLAMEIKSLPNLSLDKQFGAYMQYERQIEGVRQRIAELRQQMQEMANDPNASRLVKKQTLEEINSLQQKIVQLEHEQITATQQIANADKQVLAEKQAQYEKERQELIQLSAGERERVVFTKQQTDELDKQLQKIKEIDSVKSAKSVYEKVSSMPTDNVDQAKEKLEALYALKEKVRNTPLLSKSAQNNLEVSIDNTKKKIEQLGFAARGTNQTEASVKSLNAAVEQNIQKEQQRRREIQETGVAAQQTLRQITQSVGTQLELGTDKPIAGMRELETAIRQMRAAYFELNGEEKVSPLGKALESDIKRAEMLSSVLQAHNKTLTGMSVGAQNPIDNSIGSYERLSNIVKTLTEEFRRMGREERNSAKGTDVIDKIQAVNREIRDVQRTMNRPTSLKKALGLDESTLDHINDKLQALRLYKGGLKITDPKQLEEMTQVDAEISRLQKNYDKLMAKNQQMIGSNNALGRSWNYMKNRLAFYFSVGASTAFIKNLIEVRSQYEMNERALGILINSAERGTQIFNELSQMALVSPYTLIELSNAAKQLTAYDIAAKDVVDTTRRLADMASAVGVPMERLTYALGQIKAYGYLNSRDARMFANAGIPLVRELSKYYSELEGKVVSVGDVYTRMKKKAIEYNDVMAVVTKMTDEGGKFFDFQAKMADTLKVRLANLTLAWNNMLNDIGASQQGVLTSGIGILRDLFLHWQDIYGAIQRVVLAIGLWKGAQALALLAIGELNTKMGMQVLLGEKLQTRLSGLAGSTKNLVSGYAAAGAALLFVVADAIMTYQRNAEEIEKLNKVIVDGAKESANSIYEFIESAEMSYARLSARTGKLPKPDAEKTWDALREQIELSAISAKDIIPELIKIEDLNERVTKAFNLAERIAEANNKLIDLDGKLDISQNSILFGLFGEGLVEDIDDFNERLRISAQTEELYFKSTGSVITDVVQGLTGFFNDMKEKLGSSTEEAELEIKNFAHNAAEAIKDELGEEGLKDSIQVNEAVSRVLKGIEQQFPQIKGQGKALFESIYNDIMAKEFEGAVDKQAYYYKLFLERLKKDHGSAFQGVTDDVLKETHRWSSGQQDAINKTAEKIKKDIPEAYQDSITAILNDLNKREFKMRIVAEFATTTLDDVQKQFREKFIEKDALGNTLSEKDQTERQQKYGSLMIKNNESDLEYQERIKKEKQKQLDISKSEGDIISRNQGKTDAWSKAIVARATEAKKAADDTLSAINDIESGGYDFTTKKENAAASKAQKAAETELQKALKDELQLIDKVRSQYKKLTDAGATDGEALAMVTNQFANSLAHVNKVLGKNGIPLFDISKFAGTDNPRALLDMLKLQLDSAKIAKNIKPEEIKELEVKYSEIVVDAKSYDLTKVTKGLNNELDRLKDEYELAVSLDADPELGNMFADWMGIDVNDLPRTASEYAERASKILNNKLKDLGAKTELPSVLDITDDDMRAFEENKVFTEKQLELVKKAVEAARGFQRKETEDRIKDWDKLLEKYAEYETKVNKIQNDAVKERVTFAQQFGNDEEKRLALNLRTQILAATDPQEKQKLIQQLQELVKSIAGDDKTKLNIVTSINTGETRNLAKASFEEFQKSPEWITATGNLAGMTTRALGSLIDKLEEYKRSAQNLNPKQIKNLNNALKSLYSEQKKNNPFKAISVMMLEAQNRALNYNDAIDDTRKEIDRLEKEEKYAALSGQESSQERLDRIEELKKRLEELIEKQNQAGKLSTEEIVSAFNSIISIAKAATSVVTDFADALGGNTEGFKQFFSVLEKGGQGAAIGAQVGGGWGAVIGGVLGIASGLISTFADELSGNAGITKSVNQAESAVKRLEIAYIDLQRAIDRAYGSQVVGAKQAMAAAKEMELKQLERQLELEESRESKNRDEDKILELKKQIKELKYEIKDTVEEITNDLMGTDAYSFAENLVSSMIQAFKQGEDYMKTFEESFDNMIDNLIMKSIVGRVVGEYMDRIWESVDKGIQSRSKQQAEEYGRWQTRLNELEEMDYYSYAQSYSTSFTPKSGGAVRYWEEQRQKEIEETKKKLELAKANYDVASQLNDSDISNLIQQLAELKPELAERLKELIGQWYTFGSDNDTDKTLSALQQGIQGVTEDTAGALEAYMNGVSQQVYYQSDLLTQIRDAVVGFDLDVQVATMSQILLQLQSSYTVQMSIQGILEGWSSANGLAVRVEMVE